MPNEVWRYAETHPILSTPLTNIRQRTQARFASAFGLHCLCRTASYIVNSVDKYSSKNTSSLCLCIRLALPLPNRILYRQLR